MYANRNVRPRAAFRCVQDIVRFRPCGDLICGFLDLRSLTALRATDTISLRARSILWSFHRRLSALEERVNAYGKSGRFVRQDVWASAVFLSWFVDAAVAAQSMPGEAEIANASTVVSVDGAAAASLALRASGRQVTWGKMGKG